MQSVQHKSKSASLFRQTWRDILVISFLKYSEHDSDPVSWKENHIYIHLSSLLTTPVRSFCRLVQSPSRTTLVFKVGIFVENSHKSLDSILNPWFSLLMYVILTHTLPFCVFQHMHKKSWAKPSPVHLCAERRYKVIFASQGSSCKLCFKATKEGRL